MICIQRGIHEDAWHEDVPVLQKETKSYAEEDLNNHFQRTKTVPLSLKNLQPTAIHVVGSSMFCVCVDLLST